MFDFWLSPLLNLTSQVKFWLHPATLVGEGCLLPLRPVLALAPAVETVTDSGLVVGRHGWCSFGRFWPTYGFGQ